MKIIKGCLLIIVSVWSYMVWAHYLEAREIVDSYNVDNPLTEKFWAWEAKGRLQLIHDLLDDTQMVEGRQIKGIENPAQLASHIASKQLEAYGMHRMLEPAQIIFTPLRGDANGVYMPREKAIFLNSKMVWADLPFERFVEVILHENMHHILTNGYHHNHQDDPLAQDFKALKIAAYFSNETDDNLHGNIQEQVAYRTQRAARYAGIAGAEYSAWDVSLRMQEIRLLRDALALSN